MNYWEERYLKNEIGWDIGAVSTPLKEYIDQLTNKACRILIPGAGNGYEFDYLTQKGFTNVFVVDIAASPLQKIAQRNPGKDPQLIRGDFFELTGTFDLILEQTFFCAISPTMREDYVVKICRLIPFQLLCLQKVIDCSFDRIERRTQLMRNTGNKLGLIYVRFY
jgi:hypothetical protein